MPLKLYLRTIIIIVILASVFVFWPKQSAPEITPEISPIISATSSSSAPFTTAIISTTSPPAPTPPTSPDATSPPVTLVEPVPDFVARVTKKPFGTYVAPDSSPVQPERFTGYHTGADAEFTDIDADVPVKSITAGLVRSSRRANGYGGLVVIEHTINSRPHLVIYGHLDPARLIHENTTVTTGQTLGYLGRANSAETDGERKHLHLAVLSGTKLDVRGYVPKQAELNRWSDPVRLFVNPTPPPLSNYKSH